MDDSNITPELLEKAKGKTAEEIVALAQDEGIELSDEQLEQVSGGWLGVTCPKCGSDDVVPYGDFNGLYCGTCGHNW